MAREQLVFLSMREGGEESAGGLGVVTLDVGGEVAALSHGTSYQAEEGQGLNNQGDHCGCFLIQSYH